VKTLVSTETRLRLTSFFLALILLGLLAGCTKKTPEALYADAELAFDRQDLIGAMLKCQKALERSADNQEVRRKAHALLVQIQLMNNRPEEARQELDTIIQEEGLTSEFGQAAYRRKIEILIGEEKFNDTIADIEKTSATLKVAPQFAWDTQLVLGQTYMQTEQTTKGLALFEHLRTRAITEQQALNATEQLVASFNSKEHYNDAIRLYEEYLVKYPNTEYKGRLYFGIGYYHQTLAEKSKNPQEKESEEKKARDNFDKSLEFFSKTRDEELLIDKKTQIAFQMVKVYLTTKEYDKALALLDKCAQEYAASKQTPEPTPVMITMQKASVYLEANQKDKAMQELQTALEPLVQAQDNRRTIVMGGIAGLYADDKNYEKAIEWYNKIREEFPNTNVAAQAEQGIRMVKAEQEKGATTATATTAPTTATQSLVPPPNTQPQTPPAPPAPEAAATPAK
jgi:tetratricopeptide (TPR) repeat protein